MPILMLKSSAVFSGIVDVESAEVLHHKLLENPTLGLDCKGVEHVHAAVLQVLLAHGRSIPVEFFPIPKDGNF